MFDTFFIAGKQKLFACASFKKNSSKVLKIGTCSNLFALEISSTMNKIHKWNWKDNWSLIKFIIGSFLKNLHGPTIFKPAYLISCFQFLQRKDYWAHYKSDTYLSTIFRVLLPTYDWNYSLLLYFWKLFRLSSQWSWAVVQREKKYLAYDLHPVLIPYLVSQNS